MAKPKITVAPKAGGATAEKKILCGIVDDGTREIPLVNKFGKLICNIYIRPADFSILDRCNALSKDFDALVKPLTEITVNRDGTANFEKDWAVLKSVETELKKRINELFDMEEADDIFATRNAFSSVGGEFYCAKVLVALEGLIAAAVEEEAELSKKRTAKYLKAAPESPEVNANAGDTTDHA